MANPPLAIEIILLLIKVIIAVVVAVFLAVVVAVAVTFLIITLITVIFQLPVGVTCFGITIVSTYLAIINSNNSKSANSCKQQSTNSCNVATSDQQTAVNSSSSDLTSQVIDGQNSGDCCSVIWW